MLEYVKFVVNRIVIFAEIIWHLTKVCHYIHSSQYLILNIFRHIAKLISPL